MFWIIWDLAKWIMIGLQAPVVDEHDLELLRGLFWRVWCRHTRLLTYLLTYLRLSYFTESYPDDLILSTSIS